MACPSESWTLDCKMRLVIMLVFTHVLGVCSERLSTFNLGDTISETLTKEAVVTALEGVWDTDYHPTVASGFANASTKVTIVEMDEDDEDFLHGELRGRLAFWASSPKFADKQGNGQRLITVTHLENNRAVLDQRMDTMHATRHSGDLTISARGWEIIWDHERKWTRLEKPPALEQNRLVNKLENDDNAEEAKRLSMSLIEKWEENCAAFPAVSWDVSVTFGAGAGLNLLGVGFTVGVMVCASPQIVQRSQARLTCILGQMKTWTNSKGNSSETKAATALATDELIQRFSRWATASLMADCYAGLCFEFDFGLSPVAPFVSPIPSISANFMFPMTFKDIMDCSARANATSYISEAFAAQPKQDDQELHNLITEAQEKATSQESARSASMSSSFCQGPSFALFPIPGSVGWWWNVDVTLTMSVRKMMKAWRTLKFDAVNGPQTTCEAERREYFHAVRSWAKSAHKVVTSSSCGVVRDMLADIKKHHPSADIERNPFGLVPHLEQLGGKKYQQSDFFDVSLGGAYIYVGMDGVSIGYYHSLTNPSSNGAYYNQDCIPFQEFVNIYQARVVHQRMDLLSWVRQDACELRPLPSLEFHSCRAVESYHDELTQSNVSWSDGDAIPAFPTIKLTRPQPTGKLFYSLHQFRASWKEKLVPLIGMGFAEAIAMIVLILTNGDEQAVINKLSEIEKKLPASYKSQGRPWFATIWQRGVPNELWKEEFPKGVFEQPIKAGFNMELAKLALIFADGDVQLVMEKLTEEQMLPGISSISDSQCTRCITTTSYGSPCDYCAGEGIVATSPTCRQPSSWHLPCPMGRVTAHGDNLDLSNQEKRSLAAQHCILTGKVVYEDTEERASITYSDIMAIWPEDW